MGDSGNFIDRSSRCGKLVSRGECYKNPRYMMQNCMYSCFHSGPDKRPRRVRDSISQQDQNLSLIEARINFENKCRVDSSRSSNQEIMMSSSRNKRLPCLNTLINEKTTWTKRIQNYIMNYDDYEPSIKVRRKKKLDPEPSSIVGEVQFLFDFAIFGFGKCGTTTIHKWLEDHEQVRMFPNEVYLLDNGNTVQLLRNLYNMKRETIEEYRIEELKKSKGDDAPVVTSEFYSFHNVTRTFQGFKSPISLRGPTGVQELFDHFPETKIIISVRHPMSWFKSLYNFFINKKVDPQAARKEVDQGLHSCSNMICLDKGRFHKHASWLGKTPMVEQRELDLLFGFEFEKKRAKAIKKAKSGELANMKKKKRNRERNGKQNKPQEDWNFFGFDYVGTESDAKRQDTTKRNMKDGAKQNNMAGKNMVGKMTERAVENLPRTGARHLASDAWYEGNKVSNPHDPQLFIQNKVFFLEVSQLSDHNRSRVEAFQKDLAQFVGLDKDKPLQLPPHFSPGKNYFGAKKNATARMEQDKNVTNKVNIDLCHANYTHVRMELMGISRNASIWFRDYFLKSSDVVVSSREYLNDILMTWMQDPCDDDNDLTL